VERVTEADTQPQRVFEVCGSCLSSRSRIRGQAHVVEFCHICPASAADPRCGGPRYGLASIVEICRIAQSAALRFSAGDGREPQSFALRNPAFVAFAA
jgi:hypothetical protein